MAATPHTGYSSSAGGSENTRKNGEIVAVMSAVDRNISPSRFQIVRMIKCEGPALEWLVLF